MRRRKTLRSHGAVPGRAQPARQQFEEADGRPRETCSAGLPAVCRVPATLLAPVIQ